MLTRRTLKKLLLVGALAMALLIAAVVVPHQLNKPTGDMVASSSDGLVVDSDPDGPGPRPDGVPRIDGMLVVDLQDGTSWSEIHRLSQDYGMKLQYNSEHSVEASLTVARVADSRLPVLLAELAQDPRVQSASPNYVYQLYDLPAEPADFPNDPMYQYQWHMRQIKAQEAWRWSTGRHAVVAIIDTGVAYLDYEDRFHRVEDLEQTRIVPGYDFVNRRTQALDDHAHGTHVAGTVAQSTHNGKGVVGVAYEAAIMPIKVLSGRGSGTLADVADGIRFSADHGANVINLSLGGPFPDATMAEAVRYANARGTLVVCAAGNSSRPKSGYPAGYAEAVSVSSTDYEEELAWYSNHGPDIDIAAPGGDTRHDKNGDGKPDGVLQNTIGIQNPGHSDYYWFQGTSMACPHVAGVAALVSSLGVTNPSAVLRVLKGTAQDKGEEGRERGYGAGIVDAEAAAFQAGFMFGLWKFVLALAIGLLVMMPLLRRMDILGMGLLLPGLVIGSSGLFFLPLVMGNETPLQHFLVTGFPSWDLALLGASNHGNPIMFSCLIPMVLAVLVVENRMLRSLVAGFTAGIAAHLLFTFLMGTVSVAFVPFFLSRLWLLGNGLICVFLAVVLSEEQP